MSELHDRNGTPAQAARRRYRRAGWVYFALAMVIVVLTVADPELAAPERRADLVHLLVGLPFIAAFAVLVGRGDDLLAAPARWLGASAEGARRLGAWVHEKLVMLLTLSALGRTLFYVSNGVGLRPRLRPALAFEAVPASPQMLVNAVLMAVILVVLARASWVPFVERLRRRRD